MGAEDPIVVVHVNEDGTVRDVEVPGHTEPTEVEGSTRDEPVAAFGDDEFREGYSVRARPWLA
jgi:hypothetical protein